MTNERKPSVMIIEQGTYTPHSVTETIGKFKGRNLRDCVPNPTADYYKITRIRKEPYIQQNSIIRITQTACLKDDGYKENALSGIIDSKFGAIGTTGIILNSTSLDLLAEAIKELRAEGKEEGRQ